MPSVKAAWFADVRRAGSVGRNVFWPAPNVDSGLVAWTHRDPPAVAATREQVFAVVDAAFAQRRKTLRSTLKQLAGSAEAAEAALRARRRRPDGPRRGDRRRAVRADRRGPAPGERRRTGAVTVTRARQDQPAPGRRAGRAPTASTRWPPSTRRSACTTRSRVTDADDVTRHA